LIIYTGFPIKSNAVDLIIVEEGIKNKEIPKIILYLKSKIKLLLYYSCTSNQPPIKYPQILTDEVLDWDSHQTAMILMTALITSWSAY
jgi:molybdopterin-guanine dinucleotide biosynthesis protein